MQPCSPINCIHRSRNVDAERQLEHATPAFAPSPAAPNNDESRLRGFTEVFLSMQGLDIITRKNLDPSLEQVRHSAYTFNMYR